MQFIEMLFLLLLKRKQLYSVACTLYNILGILLKRVLERLKYAFILARHAQISHLLISALTVVSIPTEARSEERSCCSSLVVSFKIEFKILFHFINLPCVIWLYPNPFLLTKGHPCPWVTAVERILCCKVHHNYITFIMVLASKVYVTATLQSVPITSTFELYLLYKMYTDL